MMADPQFKRNIAYKLRIEDIVNGNPVIENEKFTFLESNGKKVFRVNVIASVVDKYEVDGERKYVFLTVDDGSGQIKVKAFGDDSEKIKDITHGQTIAIIGLLRYYNNEIYISPEAVNEQDPKYLIVRKLELEKVKPVKITTEKSNELREKIIQIIKDAEKTEGINTKDLIERLGGYSTTKVNEEVQKFLEEGVIFEPSPGRVRWLG